MKNFVQDGKALTLIAVGAVVAGEPVVTGDALVSVAMSDAATTESFVGVTEGVFNMPCEAGTSAGDELEWSGTELVALAAGVKIGVAVADIVDGACDIKVG